MTVGGNVPARAYAVAALRAAWVAMAGLCALALLSSAVLAKPFRAKSFNYYMNDYTAELQRLAKTIDLPSPISKPRSQPPKPPAMPARPPSRWRDF